MRSPEVLVVGGGPAGSTAARLLALRGRRVTLLDRARFPRDKPCGECLNPGAVEALERLGLLERVLKLQPSLIRGWRIRGGGETAVGSFEPHAREGLGVGRRRLDAALLDAAREAGVRVVEERRVERVEPAGDDPPRIRVRGPRGRLEEWSAAAVVGADGLRSITARSLHAHARGPRIRKVSVTAHIRGRGPSRDRGRLFLSPDRAVGLAPVHAGAPLWNATVVTRIDGSLPGLAGRPGAFLDDALRSLPLRWRRGPARVAGPWSSGPFDWPVERAWAPGVVLAGDAAGYFDPLTGQGIFRALRSAELAARAVDTTLARSRLSWEALEAYDAALRREMGPGRRLQKAVEAVVARGAALRWAVRRLVRSPGTTGALIRVTGDAAPVRSLLHPRTWTSLLGSFVTPRSSDEADPCTP